MRDDAGVVFRNCALKQYDETIPYVQNKRLDEWVHRKTIQGQRVIGLAMIHESVSNSLK